MQSSHPAHLFQSESQQETGVRRAAKAASSSAGNPIYLGRKQDDVLELAAGGSGADGGKQKVLDALVDGDAMWTAESGGTVRRVDLSTGQTTHLLLAHKAPVSALAVYDSGSTGTRLLLSAGWDKSIHIWSASPDAATPRPKPLAVIRDASTDFIKALHALPAQGIVLSGGSDKVVRAWDFESFVFSLKSQGSSDTQDITTPRPVGSFSEHTRAITCIQSLSLPRTNSNDASSSSLDDVVIYTADSMGRIFQLSLSFDRTQPSARARFTVQRELRGPETSVSDLTVGWGRCTGGGDEDEDEDEDDADDDGDEADDDGATPPPPPRRIAQVWVASNDKTAQLFEPFLYTFPPTSSLKDRNQTAGGNLENLTSQTAAPSAASSSILTRTSKVGAALGHLPALSPRVAITHPDYVKSVLALGLTKTPTLAPILGTDLPSGVVLTGSADEDIRSFSVEAPRPRPRTSQGPGSSSGAAPMPPAEVRPLARHEGHWHEVERLCLWKGTISASQDVDAAADAKAASTETPAAAKAEWHVISTGLDASIRRWKLKDLLVPPPAPTSAQEPGQTAATSGDAAPAASAATSTGAAMPSKGANGGGSGMTAEEERELEELMMEDD